MDIIVIRLVLIKQQIGLMSVLLIFLKKNYGNVFDVKGNVLILNTLIDLKI